MWKDHKNLGMQNWKLTLSLTFLHSVPLMKIYAPREHRHTDTFSCSSTVAQPGSDPWLLLMRKSGLAISSYWPVFLICVQKDKNFLCKIFSKRRHPPSLRNNLRTWLSWRHAGRVSFRGSWGVVQGEQGPRRASSWTPSNGATRILSKRLWTQGYFERTGGKVVDDTTIFKL